MYSGAVEAGRPHGWGRLACDNGDEAEGAFKDGVPDGTLQGRRVYADGAVYTGELHGWMPHGAGRLALPHSALTYAGRFQGMHVPPRP